MARRWFRSFPERTAAPRQPLGLSREYMARESSRWNRSVEDWVRDYAKRNKVETSVKDDPDPNAGQYLLLHFASRWRRDVFVRQGNKEFPYFEFA
jgi:hypothetical protein